jgi:nucleoid-associated protein YgaU
VNKGIAPNPNHIQPNQVLTFPLGTFYVVKHGDTLSKIAECLSYAKSGRPVKVKNLAKKNNIPNENEIQPGKRLYIPHYMGHKVKQGDTMEKIASKYQKC